jgi:hypothetical protein
MVIHIIISLLIFLLTLPVIILSIPAVAILLLTSWNGKTTIFGNAKWGRANNHPSPTSRTSGYLQELLWLVWRNPVNNFLTETLSVTKAPYKLTGDPDIGDKTKGGFYSIRMGDAWEYYWIKPYGKRCIRARIGWKIHNADSPSAFVFAINPWKEYSGI